MHSKSSKSTKQRLFKKKYKFHYSTITEGGGGGVEGEGFCWETGEESD